MTAELLRSGEPVWLRLHFPDREERHRVVIDLGNSVVLCSEADYLLANVDHRALVGKAYPREDVRVRE